MKWEKATPETVALFDSLVPTIPIVERRKMFGYPCAFVNRNMFCGVFENSIFVRLPENRRVELIKKGWLNFAPMPGRIMKEYLVIPKWKEKSSEGIFKESLEYALTLKPK